MTIARCFFYNYAMGGRFACYKKHLAIVTLSIAKRMISKKSGWKINSTRDRKGGGFCQECVFLKTFLLTITVKHQSHDLQELMPSNGYKGQKLNSPVRRGTTPTQPQRLMAGRKKVEAIKAVPATIRAILSIPPTFFIICSLKFD